MTKVDHPILEFTQGQVIHLLGQGLSNIIKTYQFHFEFHVLLVFWPNLMSICLIFSMGKHWL